MNDKELKIQLPRHLTICLGSWDADFSFKIFRAGP